MESTSSTRRLSEIFASPWRMMERNAERIAELLVKAPAPPMPLQENIAPAPADHQPAVRVLSPKKRKSSPSPPIQKRKPSPSPSVPIRASKRIAIKQEPTRELPFRSSNRRHKCGFYNEKQLASMVWKGTGSERDPIRFDE